MPKIVSVEPRLFHVPLDEVLVDAKHGDHTHFELITATVTLDDGAVGVGYSYTGGKGGYAIHAMIAHDLAPMLVGRDATAIEDLYDDMQWHIHYVGRGGVASFAITAVDIALWDLRGRREGRSLAAMAGGVGDRCRAYCGGIDLGFELPKLLDSVQGYLDAGFDGAKIKVGRPDDADRVAAVRDLIGPNLRFMVDANYSLDEATPTPAAQTSRAWRWRWVNTSIRCTISNTRWSGQSLASSSPIPRIAAGSQAGSPPRGWGARRGSPSPATGCRNCMSASCPALAAWAKRSGRSKCIPSPSTATRPARWWLRMRWRSRLIRPERVWNLIGRSSRPS